MSRKFTGRLRPGDIKRTMALIRGITKVVHTVNSSTVGDDYRKGYKQTEATTMTATGELRSKLFLRSKPGKLRSYYAFGYDKTSNNQSVAQEFNVGGTGVRVHRTERSHYNEFGQGKCSRTPDDLWAMRGKRYLSNPRAMRKAMTKSIQRIFKTSISGKDAVQSGGDIFFTPSFTQYAMKLSRQTSALLHVLGIRQS